MLPIAGRHQAQNALAALAVADEFGITRETVARGLLSARLSGMRMQILRLGERTTLINDAYNAAPASIYGALAVLCEIPADLRLAVLGDMLELGAETERLHREVGRQLQKYGVTGLIAVGQYADFFRQGAEESQIGENWTSRVTAAANDAIPVLFEWIQQAESEGKTCVVLVKGSQRVGLEAVVRSLLSGSVQNKE